MCLCVCVCGQSFCVGNYRENDVVIALDVDASFSFQGWGEKQEAELLAMFLRPNAAYVWRPPKMMQPKRWDCKLASAPPGPMTHAFGGHPRGLGICSKSHVGKVPCFF